MKLKSKNFSEYKQSSSISTIYLAALALFRSRDNELGVWKIFSKELSTVVIQAGVQALSRG